MKNERLDADARVGALRHAVRGAGAQTRYGGVLIVALVLGALFVGYRQETRLINGPTVIAAAPSALERIRTEEDAEQACLDSPATCPGQL